MIDAVLWLIYSSRYNKMLKLNSKSLVRTKLFEILIYLGKKENIIEQKRQALCSNEAFEPR
jgi:hypothetical protein